jgi:hypothetical protein
MMIDEKGEEPKKEQVEKHCEDTESEKVPEAIVENEMTMDEKDNEPKHKDVENHGEDTENEQISEPIVESEITMDEPKQEEVENRCEDVESKMAPIVENEMAMEEKEDEPKEEQVEDVEEAPNAIVENETMLDEPKKEEAKLGAGINPNATPFVPSAYKTKKVSMSFSDVLTSQKQSRKPTKKSRCTYWPKCSNKNCKFYHPQTQCR